MIRQLRCAEVLFYDVIRQLRCAEVLFYMFALVEAVPASKGLICCCPVGQLRQVLVAWITLASCLIRYGSSGQFRSLAICSISLRSVLAVSLSNRLFLCDWVRQFCNRPERCSS